MTTFLTWSTIWSNLQNGILDLQEQTFVDESEAMAYANEAVNEAEGLIHMIYEDYFLTKADPSTVPLVQGQDEIPLPTNIYAGKVRGIIYNRNNDRIYELKRLRDFKKFLQYRLLRVNPTLNDFYQWFFYNATPGAPKALISPAAQESGNLLEVWYLRSANRFTTGTDKCDISDHVQFIYDHVRMRVYEKEGHYALQKAIADKEASKQLLIDTLTDMVPDTDNEIQADFTFYGEHT